MKKILIIGPAWVGDMVMSHTLYQLLYGQYPGVQIDVLAPSWTLPLLERMPEVNRAMKMPFAHGEFNIAKRYRLGRELRAENYDQAIVLKNSWKEALIPFFAKIPVRTGWVMEMRYGLLNDIRRLNKKKYKLMIQRYMGLGISADAELPDYRPQFTVNAESVFAAQQKLFLENLSQPVLALCPGAEYGPAKRWPDAYYAEIANEYFAKGWQVWIFGSKKDSEIAALIQNQTQQCCKDLTGQTTLGEAIDLMSICSAVISNDSGLMHIAAALKKPLVVIYGSSDPGYTPPLADDVEIVKIDIECSPCFKKICPLGHMKCLHDLKPEKVSSALARLVSV